MSPEDKSEIEKYLCANYSGVFTKESTQRHIEDYVGFGFAKQVIDWVGNSASNVRKVLDIGSGFGSFVLLCRERGIDAVGVEIAEFEVDYARRRLRARRPADDASYVYRCGNALHLSFPDAHFDVVTLWNVLEHIRDEKELLQEASRVLRPNGDLYIISPNYAAFRKEAHYLIPWIPMLPKALGRIYLRVQRKSPHFFEDHIFYTTNWGILWTTRNLGFRIYRKSVESARGKLSQPDMIVNNQTRRAVLKMKQFRLTWILRTLVYFRGWPGYLKLLNPVKNSVVLHLRKAG